MAKWCTSRKPGEVPTISRIVGCSLGSCLRLCPRS